MVTAKEVEQVLRAHQNEFHPLLTLDTTNPFVFDITQNNKELLTIDMGNAEAFSKYIFEKLQQHKTAVGVGKYNEHRTMYKWSSLFSGKDELRTVHLGIDIWVAAGTALFAPLDGKVHSFQNNKGAGDYGPTIILEHTLNEITFYTLYGHLSLESLDSLFVGKTLKKGDALAFVGEYPINGNYPPHVHFQVMVDMLGKKGDFPGVASLTTREHYLGICIDPNLILQLPINKK